MILDFKNTSGVISREKQNTKLKITFLSGKWNERKETITLINWTNLQPEIIYSQTVYVPASGTYIVEIPLVEDFYSDEDNIDLYELQLKPDIYGMKVNVFEE